MGKPTAPKALPGWASALSRADAILNWIETTFLGAAIIFASVLLLANVALRYVFLAPISWAEEVTLYVMAWIVFVGCSVAIRTRGHIAIDLLPLALSQPNRRRLGFVIGALVLVFLVVFFYFSGQHTLRVKSGGQVTPIMEAPMWLAYLSMPVASVLMFIRTCQMIWRMRGKRIAPTSAGTASLHD
jgi:C4-dicarboxylate transporter DctQ subunit